MGLTFVRTYYTLTMIQDVGYRKNLISHCTDVRPLVVFSTVKRKEKVKFTATGPH